MTTPGRAGFPSAATSSTPTRSRSAVRSYGPVAIRRRPRTDRPEKRAVALKIVRNARHLERPRRGHRSARVARRSCCASRSPGAPPAAASRPAAELTPSRAAVLSTTITRLGPAHTERDRRVRSADQPLIDHHPARRAPQGAGTCRLQVTDPDDGRSYRVLAVGRRLGAERPPPGAASRPTSRDADRRSEPHPRSSPEGARSRRLPRSCSAYSGGDRMRPASGPAWP